MKIMHLIRPGMGGMKRLRAGNVFAAAVMFMCHAATAAQSPVNLGTAGNFVILTKSGISTVPPSAITGNIGVSPINSTAITGFALSLTAASPFATSTQVTGNVYAPDYAAPTPANLTTAIGDMQTAYTDAAGRTSPDHTELGSGQIGGLTLDPGLYKWSTDVLISSDVTLNGGPNDVWIFQIAGKITQASGTRIHLTGGASAANIFWQAFGDVSLGTTTHFEGIILAQTSISLDTGASINGRLLAQTAVTLDANTVTFPASAGTPTLVSAVAVTGPYSDAIGQSLDLGTKTITVPLSGNTQFYRIRSVTTLTITSVSISAGNVVITYN
ncbi:MAG TPA: ice-binding family protein [Verrucomicrobiae bacterium]